MTGQWPVFEFLKKNEGKSYTNMDLIEIFDNPKMSQLTKKLADSRLIERVHLQGKGNLKYKFTYSSN